MSLDFPEEREEVFLQVNRCVLRSRVPVIFTVVVCAADNCLGNCGPTVWESSLAEEQKPILLSRPVSLNNHRVQLVIPALSYLLPTPVRTLLRQKIPVLWSVLRN